MRSIATLFALVFSRKPRVVPYQPQYLPLLPQQREVQRAISRGILRSVGVQ